MRVLLLGWASLLTGAASAFGTWCSPDDRASFGPLEPSVQNEVDRAVSLGERWLAAQVPEACTNAPPADLFATNGLARDRIAVKLVSMQRSGGWWLVETNAAPTRLAVEILKGL